jgi:ubiquinone/menaquinone biosynthesis C-methylase UbiE
MHRAVHRSASAGHAFASPSSTFVRPTQNGRLRRIKAMSTATIADPSIKELNEKLENFKDSRFTDAQEANALKDLERFDGKNIESFRRGIELVRDLPVDDFSMLDIGCGIGLYGVLLGKYSGKRFSYTGCDFSPAMIDAAKRLNPGCGFHQCDARKIDIPDRSMDVVWISAVLEHVPEFEKVLAEAARITRKYVLLHRLFIHEGPTQKQILTTSANEYPYEGFSYPRTIRNAAEFDSVVHSVGQIVKKQPWTFDASQKQNLCLYSYTIRL